MSKKIFSKVEFSILVYNIIYKQSIKKDNVPDAVIILGKLKTVPW